MTSPTLLFSDKPKVWVLAIALPLDGPKATVNNLQDFWDTSGEVLRHIRLMEIIDYCVSESAQVCCSFLRDSRSAT